MQIVLGDRNCPLHSKSKMALHLFCKCLLPINNAAATGTRPLASGNRAWVFGREHTERRCPGHLPKSQDELSARIARTQGQYWPTHMHTHGSASSRVPDAAPRPGAGGSPGAESSRRGGCPRTELEHSLPCGRNPALAPPIAFSRARAPRAPCRARARACAGPRALRGRPRRAKESVDP